jgi:hypothetical protein
VSAVEHCVIVEGTLQGNIDAGPLADVIVVNGAAAHVQGNVKTSGGADVVLLSGGTIDGQLWTEDGADIVDGCSASVGSTVDLGADDDCVRFESVSAALIAAGPGADVCDTSSMTFACETNARLCEANPCPSFQPACKPLCACSEPAMPCHAGSPCDLATCVVVKYERAL